MVCDKTGVLFLRRNRHASLYYRFEICRIPTSLSCSLNELERQLNRPTMIDTRLSNYETRHSSRDPEKNAAHEGPQNVDFHLGNEYQQEITAPHKHLSVQGLRPITGL
jgi:hypothetical protein